MFKASNSNIINDGIYATLGSFFQRFSFFLITVFLANNLLKEDFGNITFIRSTIDSFLIFSGFGLATAVNKFVPESSKEPEALNYIFSAFFILIFNVIFIIFLFLLTKDFYEFTTNTYGITSPVIYVCIIIFISSSFNRLFASTLNALQKFKNLSFGIIISSIISLPISFFFFNQKDFINVFIGYAIIELILLFILLIFLKRIFSNKNHNLKSIKYNIFKDYLYKIFIFALPAFLSGLLVVPVMWFARLMLINSDSGALHLADFEVGFQLMAIAAFLPTAISAIILPKISSHNKSIHKYLNTLKLSSSFVIVTSIFISIIFILFGDVILSIYGDGFNNKYVYNLLIISSLFLVLNNIIGKIIASRDKMWYGFLFNVIWALCFVLLSYFFINQNFGSLSLAYSFLIAHIFHFFLQSFFSIKLLKNIK